MITASPPVRVIIAEDHALVRAGLVALLTAMDGLEVLADAKDGRTALQLILEHRPDIAVLDITMPGLSGIDVLPQVRAAAPEVRVIVLSMHDNEEYVRSALRAGAAGYLLKGSEPGELELAIRSVARGATYLSPMVSRYVVDDYLRSSTAGGSSDGLTARQREILLQIAEGRTNQEIATLLTVSVKTVETHRAKLMERLDIHDVAGLVRYAIRSGLIPADR